MDQQLACTQLESERLILQPLKAKGCGEIAGKFAKGYGAAVLPERGSGGYGWLILPRLIPRPVGVVLLLPAEEGCCGMLSYELDSLWHGMGLLSEALAMVKEFALSEAGFSWIKARISPRDPFGRRLLEHLGLGLEQSAEEGVLTFGLFRSEEELLEMEDSGSWSCQRGACHYGA